MPPDHDTDPTAPPASGNGTDPIFPPKIGRGGPRAVQVTAVQGPGLYPAAPAEGTTERLLTGLTDAPDSEKKTRKRDATGASSAAFSVSPRPLPVAHEQHNEPPVIVASASNPRRHRVDETRDEPTVELPRTRHLRLVPVYAAVAGALLVVGIYFLLRTPAPPEAAAPPSAKPVGAPSSAVVAVPVPEPVAVPAPSEDLPDPVIESQRAPRAKGASSVPRPSASASAALVPAPPSAAPAAAPLAPDYDELKKGIKH